MFQFALMEILAYVSCTSSYFYLIAVLCILYETRQFSQTYDTVEEEEKVDLIK